MVLPSLSSIDLLNKEELSGFQVVFMMRLRILVRAGVDAVFFCIKVTALDARDEHADLANLIKFGPTKLLERGRDIMLLDMFGHIFVKVKRLHIAGVIKAV